MVQAVSGMTYFFKEGFVGFVKQSKKSKTPRCIAIFLTLRQDAVEAGDNLG